MTKHSNALVAAARRKALAVAAACALTGLLVLAGALLPAASAEAAWLPSMDRDAGRPAPALAPPATPAVGASTAAGQPESKPPTPSPSPAESVTKPLPTKLPAGVHTLSATAVPTHSASAAVRAPAPPAVHRAASTTAPVPSHTLPPIPSRATAGASPTPTVAPTASVSPSATVSETPWPTFVDTESAVGTATAGVFGGSADTNNAQAPGNADLTLSSKPSHGPNLMTWMLILLCLTLAAATAVGLYAMNHMQGRRGGAHS